MSKASADRSWLPKVLITGHIIWASESNESPAALYAAGNTCRDLCNNVWFRSFVCKTRMSGVSMFRDADDHMTRDCSPTCARL